MSFWKKHIRLKLCGAVIVLFVISLSLLFARLSIPTGSWGLSFQQEGKAPVGNANSQALAQDVYKRQLKDLGLVDADGFDQAVVIQLADNAAHAVVAEAAGVVDVYKRQAGQRLRGAGKPSGRRSGHGVFAG